MTCEPDTVHNDPSAPLTSDKLLERQNEVQKRKRNYDLARPNVMKIIEKAQSKQQNDYSNKRKRSEADTEGARYWLQDERLCLYQAQSKGTKIEEGRWNLQGGQIRQERCCKWKAENSPAYCSEPPHRWWEAGTDIGLYKGE